MVERRLRLNGTTGFIIRRNYGDLYENIIVKYQQEEPWMDQYYHKGEKEYRFDNGSRIAFKYADTTDEVRQLSRGPEAMDIFVDQAEQFSEQELLWLKTPNRWPSARKNQCKYVLFFNPGGSGTEYLRRIFHLKRYREDQGEFPTNYAFLQAYGWDNYEWFRDQVGIGEREFYGLTDQERFQLFIKETSYGRDLNALPPSLRVGELLGSFENFSGQYFAGVWGDHCVLPKSQAEQIIKPWWTKWMAQDWGFGDHDAHGWYASGKLSPSEWMQHFGGHVDHPMNVVIKYREYIVNQRAEADLAMDIIERTPEAERRAIQRFYLSIDAFGRRAKQPQFGANSIGEQFTNIMRRHGLPSPEPADQRRIDGWRFMYNGFRQASLRGQRITEEQSKQGYAYFVSADCPTTMECVPLGVRDEEDREDMLRVDGALWEDVLDCDRYGLLSMLGAKPQAPRDVRAKELYNSIQGETMQDTATSRAIAMQRFTQQEAQKRNIGRPRWRSE